MLGALVQVGVDKTNLTILFVHKNNFWVWPGLCIYNIL